MTNQLNHIFFKEFITSQRGFDLTKENMCNGPYPVVDFTSFIGHHNEYKIEPPGVITGRSGSLGFVQYINENYWLHNTALWVKNFKNKFQHFVDDIFSQILNFRDKNTNHCRTRDLLLPKLISGEVDVSSLAIPKGELTQ